MVWFLVFLFGAFVLYRILRKFKVPKVGSMSVVTGQLKSGKSTFSLYLAYTQYKRNLRRVKIRNWFRRVFHLGEIEEFPLFYSTVPVALPNVDYVLLTPELLMRTKRFRYKSVIWVDEASLLADSQCFKDQVVNDRLLLFNKLLAHETKGGMIVYNTQSIQDLHYSVKRCISEFFYVHETFRWLPFFLIVTVREDRYSEDGSVLSVYTDDVEKTLQRVIVPKKVWKMFDCYCYSVHTDDLPVYDNVEEKSDSLKAFRITSFNSLHCIEKKKKEVDENEKEDD